MDSIVSASYTVLLYHGVHADDLELGLRNSSGKHIPRSRFESEMRYLHDHVPVVSMREIAAAHRGEAGIPDGAAAVTFDDGFWNNYAEAWPVLEQFGIKATIYLATGFIGGSQPIWTDRLEAALMNTSCKEVRVATRQGDVALGDVAFSLNSADSVLAALAAIKRICKAMPPLEIAQTVAAMEQQLEARANSAEPLYRFMRWDEAEAYGTFPLDRHWRAHRRPRFAGACERARNLSSDRRLCPAGYR